MSFHTSILRASAPLDLVHSDVWGPAPAQSRGGARYFVLFIDDYSRKIWLYLMKEKSQVKGVASHGGEANREAGEVSKELQWW